jgi:hypothetical protein
MTLRACIATALVVAASAFQALARPADPPSDRTPVSVKEGTFSAQLLLPLFLVDTLTPDGLNTLWAIRNESTSPINVVIRYYGADRPDVPQNEQTIALGAKEIRTVNIGSVLPSLNLQIDPDGVVRGYVTFATEHGESAIHGDYFLVNGAQNFASGSRLVNTDPGSNGNDLCRRFSVRFLDSSVLFDSGTVFTVWFQATEPTSGIAFSYFVYDEAGGTEQLSSSFPATDVAFQVTANLLMSADPNLDLEFGAIEFEFPAGVVGHISVVMSAFDRFSVGYEATCLDPT